MNKVVRQILAAQRAEQASKMFEQREARLERHPAPKTLEEMVAVAKANREALRDAKTAANEKAAKARSYPTRLVTLRLDDAKVVKQFGASLTKGYRLPYTMQRAAGMRWQRVGKTEKLKPHIVTAHYELLGERVGPGVWRFKVPVILYQKVITWLLTMCGPTANAVQQLPRNRAEYPKRQGKDGTTRKQMARWGHHPERIDHK